MSQLYQPDPLPQTDLDPLSPPWQQQLITAGDQLAGIQASIDAAYMQRTAEARTALVGASMTVGQEITSRLQAAKADLDAIQSSIETEIASRVGQAMAAAEAAGMPELSANAIMSTIAGQPVTVSALPALPLPPNGETPGPIPEYGIREWQGPYGGRWYAVGNNGQWFNISWNAGAGGWVVDIDSRQGPPPNTVPDQPGQPKPAPPTPLPTPVPGGGTRLPELPPIGPIPDACKGWTEPSFEGRGYRPGSLFRHDGKGIIQPGEVVPPGVTGDILPHMPIGGTFATCQMLWGNGSLNWADAPGQVCGGCKPDPVPTPPPGPTPPAPPPGDLLGVLQCICDAIKDRKPGEAPAKSWKLWSGKEGCYIQLAELSPKATADVKLTEGEPSSAWIGLVLASCKRKEEEQPRQPDKPPGQIPAQCVDLPSTPIVPANTVIGILDWIRSNNQGAQDNQQSANLLGSLFGIPGFGDSLSEFIRWFIKSNTQVIDSILRIAQCGTGDSAIINANLILQGFLRKWVSDLPPAAYRPLEQQRDYLCPTELPSPAEATAAWLSDTVDHTTWECWTRAAGVKPGPAERIRHALRAKLTAGELAALYHRERITGQEYSTRLRQIGFTDQAIPGEIDALTQQIPTIGDLIRMMVRDVGDEGLVNRFGLDDQFDVKWQGKLKQFGDWQNIHPEFAKLMWRAHWSIPSPTALYTMLHRLRHEWIPADRRVTEDDIRTALQQADILPFWIEKLLAISYAPLTRVDVRRAFEIGVLDREAVRRSYLDLGYNDDDAETLTSYTEKDKRRKLLNSPLLAKYGKVQINRTELEERLQALGATTEDMQAAVTRGRSLRKINVRNTCNSSTKKRYLNFEFDALELRNKLAANGADQEDVDSLAEAWACERSARGKVIPAETACRLFSRGLLSLTELYQRFLAIGYSGTDAALMSRDCAARVQEKLTKDQLALMSKQAREAQKSAKEREADERRRLADEKRRLKEAQAEQAKLDKQIAQRESLTTKARELEEQRSKLIMAAAVKIANRSDEDLAVIYHKMRSAIYTSIPTLFAGIDPAVDAGTIASQDVDVQSFSRWRAVWESLSTGVPPPADTDTPEAPAE